VLKSVIVDARSITFFANGNGITVRGDFSRRVIRTCLDALIERPQSDSSGSLTDGDDPGGSRQIHRGLPDDLPGLYCRGQARQAAAVGELR
jgi:hypothetical protein